MLQAEQLQSFNLTPTHNLSKQLHSPQVRKKIQQFSFSLSDKIGKGYTSVVYKGRNDSTQEVVAIKVIQLKSLNDQIKRNLLQTELECIKKINHCNLLRFIDSYETVNNCYIVTEYCEGGDLEKLLRVKGRFSQAEFMGFFKQIYAGYQSFLQAGFIHRDLKPANIFIKGDQLKIADFGMVKKLSENPRDNYNVGTPVYMPPESLISNIYSQKSDVWSIGVMCYQLTHGTFPWRGQDERELKLNIQNTRITYDYSLVSVELATFINQCLDKNPNTRIGIAEMMGNNWVRGAMGENSYRVSYGISINGVSTHARNSGVLVVRNNQGNVLTDRNMNAINPLRSYTAPKSISLNHIPSVTMLPLQAVPSLQLIDTKQNTNTLNYPMKSERPTMDSESSAPQPPKRMSSLLQSSRPSNPSSLLNTEKAPTKSSNPPKKSALDYLISILNYLRYLYKIYKIVTQMKSKLLPEALGNGLKSILLRELMKGLANQEKVMKNKENVYVLANWDQFVSSKKWATYANVVGQYSQKYRKIYSQQQHAIEKISIPLKQSLEQLHRIVQDNLSSQKDGDSRQIYELIELIDYLVTVYNMEEAIFCYGWLIFVEKSNINDIVECRCLVTEANWQEIWGKLADKVLNIGHYR